MDGKGIVYAKAYFIFCGIHGNNFVILRISETKISHCLMLIISLTCNNSVYLWEKFKIRIVPETDNILT